MYVSIREQFLAADKDNSGFLNVDEFHSIVRSDFVLSQDLVSAMLATIDSNADGRINYIEFLNSMIESHDTEEVYVLPEIDDVTAEISKFDLREETEEIDELYELPEVENVTEEIQKLHAYFSK